MPPFDTYTSKSLRVATGAIVLRVLSGIQERLMMVMDNQMKGISTSH